VLAIRRLASRHRAWAALLLAVALFMKAVVPAGYMPTQAGRTLTMTICSGSGPQTIVMHMAGDRMPGGDEDPDGNHHGANGHPCTFSALAGPALAATDPVLLARALVFAFVFALLAATPAPPRAPRYLLPPLRGPPLQA
jgi:hypothetical protein